MKFANYKGNKLILFIVLLLIVSSLGCSVFSNSKYDKLLKYVEDKYNSSYTVLNKRHHSDESGSDNYSIIGFLNNDKNVPFYVKYDNKTDKFSDNYTELKEGEKVLSDNYLDDKFDEYIAVMELNLEKNNQHLNLLLSSKELFNFDSLSYNLKQIYKHYQVNESDILVIDIYFSNNIMEKETNKIFMSTFNNKFDDNIIKVSSGYLSTQIYTSEKEDLDTVVDKMLKYLKEDASFLYSN